jgi:hypothetical protein
LKLEDLARIPKIIDEIVTAPRFLNQTGALIRRIVYNRTKMGYGVDDDESPLPSRRPLDPLSPGYIDRRRRTGVRGKFGAPNRSNLTYTGQMLEALTWEVDSKKGEISVFVKDTRRRGERLTNAQVEEYVRLNRPWLALTEAEQRIVVQFVEDHIKRELRRRGLY